MCWDQMASVLVVCSSEHLLVCERGNWVVGRAASPKFGGFLLRRGRASLTSRRADITGPEPIYGFGFCRTDAVPGPPATGRKTIAASDHWRDLCLGARQPEKVRG